jgi:8-oxo-dGTP pyrophosphatase MutT (NUDIX family)
VIEKEEIRRIITGRQRQSLPLEKKRLAAVLVPLYMEGGGLQILLIKRTEHVKTHQGQIAFPGGTWHPGDANPIATALREAHEEMGIRPADVEVLGELDDTSTATSNFLITPVVGFIPSPYPFQIETGEIADLLSLSLRPFGTPKPSRRRPGTEKGAASGSSFAERGPTSSGGPPPGSCSTSGRSSSPPLRGTDGPRRT